MDTNLLQPPAIDTSPTDAISAIEPEQFLNRTAGWLADMVVLCIGVVVCAGIAGLGFHFSMVEGLSPVNVVASLLGLLGAGGLIGIALDRYRFFQDKTPKITLSADAICDHRSGTNVEFLDAQSFYFDQRFIKGNETRAALHLALGDGSEHIFDLKNLNVPSKEIALKVQSYSGLESVKPAVSSDPRQDRLMTIFAIAMLSLLFLRVAMGLFGIEL